MIQGARARGDLLPGQTIYEGTSGSTGISLGLISNLMGYKTKIFLPDILAPEKYRILEVCNCKISKIPNLNWIDENNCVKMAQATAEAENGYFAGQFDNMDNFFGHYTETGPEIWEQMGGRLNIYVNGAGTGATIAGVARFLKEKDPSVKIVLADPQGSSLHSKVMYDVLYTNEDKEGHKEKCPDRTIVEGVGLNRLTKNFLAANYDHSFRVEDLEALHMAYFLIENEGLFLGTSSALNLVACVKASRKFKRSILGKGLGKGCSKEPVIVTNGCDQGIRYLSKFYNKEYLAKRGVDFKKRDTYRGLKTLDFVK
jgi:cysteine synthase A